MRDSETNSHGDPNVTVDPSKTQTGSNSPPKKIAKYKVIQLRFFCKSIFCLKVFFFEKGDIVVAKSLKIPNFQVKNSTMRELRTVINFGFFQILVLLLVKINIITFNR